MRYLLTFLFLFSCIGVLFAQETELASNMEKGAKLYKKNCASCHTKKGTGKGKRIPPLAGSDYLMNNRVASIRAIKYGLEGKITVNGVVYDKVMKAVELTDHEIAHIMNYIMNSWGNQSDSLIAVEKVSTIQKN